MSHSTAVDAAYDEIVDALRAAGDPRRADHEQRYLKSTLTHYGASVPAIRRVVRTCLRHHGVDVRALATKLWADPVHEHRMAAVEALAERVDDLGVADLALVERLVREARTWALVDGLAATVAGGVVARAPDAASVLDRWAVDDDFWVRRSALLALLVPLRRGGGDFERFGRYADAMLEEKEFFIRKAIGWVLRDTARKRPDLVFDWLLPRAARASAVTIREAVKPMSDAQRAELQRARSS